MIFNNIRKMWIFTLMLVSINYLMLSAQQSAESKFDLPSRLNNRIVYEDLYEILGKYMEVNLATGTPELFPPTFLTDSLSNVSTSTDLNVHQYMTEGGYPKLREEIALLYSSLIKRSLNSSENIIITMGVTGGIYLTVYAHTEPGDEWIVIEPAFEDYFANIKMAGGKVVPVQLIANSTEGKLRSRDFTFDKEQMRNAFNSRTKGIIVNSPHNPTGKTFTEEELRFIGDLAVKWNVLILFDEVYEWIDYGSIKHVRMASLGEDIFNRTISLSSLSKTFFASGFRVGWAYGPAHLISNLKALQPYIIYSGNSYAQVAAATGIRYMRTELARTNSFFDNLAKSLMEKRDLMLEILGEIGVDAVIPDSGFFIYMNWTSLESRISDSERVEGKSKDWKMVNWVIKNTGVLLYPGTGMYLDQKSEIGEDYVRLCFAKGSEILNNATELLKKLKK